MEADQNQFLETSYFKVIEYSAFTVTHSGRSAVPTLAFSSSSRDFAKALSSKYPCFHNAPSQRNADWANRTYILLSWPFGKSG